MGKLQTILSEAEIHNKKLVVNFEINITLMDD